MPKYRRWNIRVLIRLSFDAHLATDYKPSYATMQPAPSVPVPSAVRTASMGVAGAAAGSDSGVSKTIEEGVAKRSIGVCCSEIRLCVSLEMWLCATLALLLYA